MAATYNKTEVTSVRETPPNSARSRCSTRWRWRISQDTAPKYLVNLGAVLEWERFSLGIHELVLRRDLRSYDNDGGETNGEIMFYKNEIGVDADHQSRESNFEATEGLTLTLGAHERVRRICRTSATTRIRADPVRGGNDNGAVAQYPSFSPFGINGAYYYGRIAFRF